MQASIFECFPDQEDLKCLEKASRKYRSPKSQNWFLVSSDGLVQNCMNLSQRFLHEASAICIEDSRTAKQGKWWGWHKAVHPLHICFHCNSHVCTSVKSCVVECIHAQCISLRTNRIQRFKILEIFIRLVHKLMHWACMYVLCEGICRVGLYAELLYPPYLVPYFLLFSYIRIHHLDTFLNSCTVHHPHHFVY